MSRPPRAKQAVLEAARRIVRDQGAVRLTFDALSRESGITRGGILYHYPSKTHLLQALLKADLDEWDRSSAAQAADPGHPLEGHVRMNLSAREDGIGELVAGLLTSSSLRSPLLETVREHERKRFEDWTWDDEGLDRYLLMLASEGAFWRNHFGLAPDDAVVSERLRQRIQRLWANRP